MDTQPLGTFPFGSPLRDVVQKDRQPKDVFVLGVYASAVHARWTGPNGRQLVQALAVASEPTIFWDGTGAEALVRAIPVPKGAGRLDVEFGKRQFNGPSGRSLDANFLTPLGLDRSRAWLCDLVPHTCLNPAQGKAIKKKYEPLRARLGLPAVKLPPVPKVFADDARRADILGELVASGARTLVLLGDQPVRHFLRHYDARWARLADFGRGANEYGCLHKATIDGCDYNVLPLAHPRQVDGLGSHSVHWREAHAAWQHDVAPSLLAG